MDLTCRWDCHYNSMVKQFSVYLKKRQEITSLEKSLLCFLILKLLTLTMIFNFQTETQSCLSSLFTFCVHNSIHQQVRKKIFSLVSFTDVGMSTSRSSQRKSITSSRDTDWVGYSSALPLQYSGRQVLYIFTFTLPCIQSEKPEFRDLNSM